MKLAILSIIVLVVLAGCVEQGKAEVKTQQLRESLETYTEDHALISYFGGQLSYISAVEIGETPRGVAFGPTLVMRVFPQLWQEDFHEVGAVAGIYEFDSVNGIRFIAQGSNRGDPTGAKRITRNGFDTLAENVMKRKGVTLKSNADVDMLIEELRDL